MVPGEEPAKYSFQLVLCLLFTLTLAADWVAVAVAGWHITFLADARIQVVWAALLLPAGIWPFAATAIRRTSGALFGMAVGLGALGLFGWGLYLTFGQPTLVRHDAFAWQGVLLTAATLTKLVEALLRRYGQVRRT